MKKRLKRVSGSVAELETRIKTIYTNKYYNLFIKSIK